MPGQLDPITSPRFDATALPRPNRHLTALALEVARLSRPLLPVADGFFLAIERSADGLLRIQWFSNELLTLTELAAVADDFHPADTDEGALQRAGLDLIDYLAGRWPREAEPAALGIVTDGFGIAFSPEHPAPLAADWMAHHASGRGVLRAIVPLAQSSACSLLAQPPANISLH